MHRFERMSYNGAWEASFAIAGIIIGGLIKPFAEWNFGGRKKNIDNQFNELVEHYKGLNQQISASIEGLSRQVREQADQIKKQEAEIFRLRALVADLQSKTTINN